MVLIYIETYLCVQIFKAALHFDNKFNGVIIKFQSGLVWRSGSAADCKSVGP